MAAVTAYVAYELEHQHQHSNSSFARSFNSAVHQVVQNFWGVSQYAVNQLAMGKKKGGIDDSLPDDPFNDPNLEDVSHPKAREKGHYQFKDKKTGEIIEYDKGKPGYPGHKGHDHYHRPNPHKTGKHDWYLDSKGNPIPDRSEPSHLYPPEWVWWN